jgi:microcystin-dependent protein
MASPYVGEIRIFAGNFPPVGWMFCDGQLLPIAEFDTLFNLIGTTYGGDGQSTFALPDLRGRIPIDQGGTHVLAQAGGTETVTITLQQMPAHRHQLQGSSDAANPLSSPAGSILANTGVSNVYDFNVAVAMSAQAVSTAGGSGPHDNMAPYLCVSFIISLFGVFPSQG